MPRTFYICRDVTCRGSEPSHAQLIDGPKPSSPPDCKLCSGPSRVFNNPNPYQGMKVSGSGGKKQRITSIPGRCNSAPPLTDVDDLFGTPTLSSSVALVTDFKSLAWKGATAKTKIRLAYPNLLSTNTDTVGMVIDTKSPLTGSALLHFDQIAKTMAQSSCTERNTTEATGEAAAALGMIRSTEFSSYVMLSGFHIHSGPGIDQVWGKPNLAKKGSYEAYIIVEAKGVGQSLTVDNFAPAKCGVQMSKDWVLDRLGRMCNSTEPKSKKVALQLVKDVGLDLHIAHADPGGSKNYWGESGKKKRPAGSASLRGLVFTAKWIGLKFDCSRTNDVMYFA